MCNLFAKLVEARLHEVNVWVSMSMEECYDEGTREWALKNACEEMGKIKDDLKMLRNATDLGVIGMLGSRGATTYHETKKRLNERLNNN